MNGGDIRRSDAAGTVGPFCEMLPNLQWCERSQISLTYTGAPERFAAAAIDRIVPRSISVQWQPKTLVQSCGTPMKNTIKSSYKEQFTRNEAISQETNPVR